MDFLMEALSVLVLTSAIVRAKLTTITDVPAEYVHELYRKLRNKDPPSVLDPASINALNRQNICEDIFGTGAFLGPPIKITEETYTELDQPRYKHIFKQLYGPKKNRLELLIQSQSHEYQNPYTLQRLDAPRTIDGRLYFYDAYDYVFACLVRKESSNEIIPYFVSKEYNLLLTEPYTAGRFVFGNIREREHLKLSEEPAIAFVRKDFNVELHYLERRNLHQPEKDSKLDPVCRLLFKVRQKNQYNRICAKVLSSSYIKTSNVVKYQVKDWRWTCTEKNISFRTEEGKLVASGKSYVERMIPCFYANHSERIRKFYISRAYRSSEVFVYTRDLFDDKVFLDTLTFNMNMIREPISLYLKDVE